MLVLTISLSMTKASKEDVVLDHVPCIYYPVCFRKDQDKVLALIDSGSEVNAMTFAYASKLGLTVRLTNVGAQKVDGSTLETFGMVLASFQVEDKLGRARFFQETFLVANTNIKVILEMLFLVFNNANVSFVQKKLIWRFYTTSEALPTTKWVKVIDWKEFAAAALNPDEKAFIVHVASLSLGSRVAIYLVRETQIVVLDTKKVIVPPEYSDYADVFLEASAVELPKHTGINNHPINLVDDK